jgi:hypothetical protein
VYNRISPAAGDDPLDLSVAIVHLLVFGVSWYECEIAGRQLMSLGAVRSKDNRAEAASSVYDGI